MRNSLIWSRLEEKRLELGEKAISFAKRLDVSRQLYSQHKTKGTIGPVMVPGIMKLLGVTSEEIISSADSNSETQTNKQELSTEDLECLAKTLRALGREKMLVRELLQLLKYKK